MPRACASPVITPEDTAACRSDQSSERAGWPLFIVLCSLWSGMIVTEQVSINLLPLTLSGFTNDAGVIGVILAINAVFGVIAQPLAGVWSDRIWTPLGRRATFLIIGAPIIAVCLYFIPEARYLWHVVALVVIYQFFQDILMGSDKPLLGDLVPENQRTLAAGLIATSSFLAAFLFLRVLMKHLEVESIYRLAAGSQIVMVCVAAFFLKEKRPRRATPRLTIASYVKDALGDPDMRRFAIMQFMMAVFFSVVGGFAVLFATQTIGISKAEFGEAWSYQVLVPMLLAVPVGVLIERMASKRWAMIFGFALGVAACLVGWFSESTAQLTVAAALMGVAMLMNQVNFMPLFTEYAPAEKIGQLAGAINIFYGLGRGAALAGVGWIVAYLDNDYRYIWPIGALAGVGLIATTYFIPDRRLEEKRRLEKEAKRALKRTQEKYG